ncbi:hypothetical protein [Methanobrevibacter sp.]|uniref:hypothetical protein n=1 Tax=Methanobrevibacter sp. TaxID=66852 RepID=UPI00388D326C
MANSLTASENLTKNTEVTFNIKDSTTQEHPTNQEQQKLNINLQIGKCFLIKLQSIKHSNTVPYRPKTY